MPRALKAEAINETSGAQAPGDLNDLSREKARRCALDAWRFGYEKHRDRYLSPEDGTPNPIDLWRAFMCFLEIAKLEPAPIPEWIASYLSDVAAGIATMPEMLDAARGLNAGRLALEALKLHSGPGRGGPIGARGQKFVDRKVTGQAAEHWLRDAPKAYIAREEFAKRIGSSEKHVRDCHDEWRRHWSKLERKARARVAAKSNR